MAKIKTLTRCPSWNTASGMMAEWSNYEHRGAALSPERANEIAANFYAVHHAKRTGAAMPRDWSTVHSSMPYQLAGWADKIAASSLIATANRLMTYFIETA